MNKQKRGFSENDLQLLRGRRGRIKAIHEALVKCANLASPYEMSLSSVKSVIAFIEAAQRMVASSSGGAAIRINRLERELARTNAAWMEAERKLASPVPPPEEP